MTERVNARIDSDLARKLEWLKQRTGKSSTEVIKASVEAYFERVKSQQKPAEMLRDFVGCAAGDPDLSERYKSYLTQSLNRKGRR